MQLPAGHEWAGGKGGDVNYDEIISELTARRDVVRDELRLLENVIGQLSTLSDPSRKTRGLSPGSALTQAIEVIRQNGGAMHAKEIYAGVGGVTNKSLLAALDRGHRSGYLVRTAPSTYAIDASGPVEGDAI